MAGNKRIDVIVIGGGQAGLSVGYHLKRRGVRFLILDGSKRIGDVWRQRWESLRLFTPAKFSSLDGMPFPVPPNSFPTKDEMANYLESYAARFELPVLSGVRVTRLSRCEGGYRVEAGDRVFEAGQVVVAMGNYQEPFVPEMAKEMDPGIVQLHAKAYQNPGQLQPGPVLVVGAGNSGAEIAKELSKTHPVLVSGRDVGQLPFTIAGFLGRLFLVRLVLRVIFHRILTIRTPIGRKVRPGLLYGSGPLIRTKRGHLNKMGVTFLAKLAGVEAGRPITEAGQKLDVKNIIWCTGYRTGFSWIDLPVLNDLDEPHHEGGVMPQAPGLYFVGLHWLFSMSSVMIHGVGRDADRIAGLVHQRTAEAEPATVRAIRPSAAA